MEDYKFLIYIALAILYYVFKGLGDKKKPVTRKKQDLDTEQPQSERPKSFEDIIRELSGEGREEIEEPEPLAEQVEKRVLDQKVDREEYENADETLKELYRKGEKLKTINELVDIEKIEKESSRFESFAIEEEENTFASEIRKGLSDPESAKKAIIYAEILNRKY